MKENIILNGKETKEYDNWKVQNLRTLNLKESKVKETVKSSPFEKFCLKKGLERDKGLWERMAEKETEMKETVLKEIKLERKGARSKK